MSRGTSGKPTVDLPLRCRCGHVRGVATQAGPSSCFRFLCYCRDCQAFAHRLGRPDMLDAAGGTDIVHMAMGRVRLTAGVDAVRCLRFSRHVLRWYAACCRTPIANTAAGAGFPLVALIHVFVDDARRDESLGPPLCRIFEASASAPLPPGAPAQASLGLRARRVAKLLSWWWQGLGRPTPFFDAATRAPISAPKDVAPGNYSSSV